MFKNLKACVDLKLDLFKESINIKFTNYKKLWIQQNLQLDSMKCKHGREVRRLNNQIVDLEKKIKNLFLECSQIPKLKYKIKRQKLRSQRGYIILKNKYDKVFEDKRKLASSKGGLISKIRKRDNKITKLEKENQDIKVLLQKVIKESKNKISPPTRRELENYDLFGSKKGRRK